MPIDATQGHGLTGLSIMGDSGGERLLREKFGTTLPIPERTKNRHLRYHEACRLYIHQNRDLDEICKLLGLSAQYLYQVKVKDDWDGFAAQIAEVMLPSKWSATHIEAPNLIAIKDENDHRQDQLPRFRKQYDRLLEEMENAKVGSKEYTAVVAALTSVARLIDDITGFSRVAKEQSNARSHATKRKIDQAARAAEKGLPAPPNGDSFKPARQKGAPVTVVVEV